MSATPGTRAVTPANTLASPASGQAPVPAEDESATSSDSGHSGPLGGVLLVQQDSEANAEPQQEADDGPDHPNILAFLGTLVGLKTRSQTDSACYICTEDFTPAEFSEEDGSGDKPVRTQCGHAYHMSCLLHMLVDVQRKDRHGNTYYPSRCCACRRLWFSTATGSQRAMLKAMLRSMYPKDEETKAAKRVSGRMTATFINMANQL
jgi:hypothetical protein